MYNTNETSYYNIPRNIIRYQTGRLAEIRRDVAKSTPVVKAYRYIICYIYARENLLGFQISYIR